MTTQSAQRPSLQASVLYSGGSDSTLSAVRLLERCDRVHLITFRRMHLWFVENAGRHVPLLRDRFGADRVEHVYLDCTEAFRRVFLDDFAADVRAFGTHLTLLVCVGCKMAMHAETILYNLEHSIPEAAIGSRFETRLYPDQLPSVKARLEDMYAGFGLSLSSPVYDMTNTDDALFAQGLTLKKDLKEQFIFYDTQPSCLYGGMAYVYSRCFYGPFFGEEAREADGLRYFEVKRPVVERFVCDRLAAKGLDAEALIARARAAAVEASKP